MDEPLACDALPERRLVIFGCGYVGTAVALEAHSRGAHVTALTRNPATAEALRSRGVEVVVADLASDAWHGQIGGSPDFVLNAVSSGGGGIDGYRQSYFGGMTSIMAWAKHAGRIGTMIYTSSTSVYPQGGGVTVDETSPTHSPDLGERGGVLAAAEEVLRTNASAACGRWFILRLAGIYGPGRHHLVDQVRAGEAAGRGDVHLNLIHRDDIVAGTMACFAAAETVANETFNLVDDKPTPKLEVTDWLAVRLGVPSPRFTEKPISERRGLTPDRRVSNTKIKALLGWNPRFRSYREGYTHDLTGS